LVAEGTISGQDLGLFHVGDKPQQVIDAIFGYYDNNSLDPSFTRREKQLELK